MSLSVITLTGGRPEAFALCRKYVGRQKGIEFKWIVVSDTELDLSGEGRQPDELYIMPKSTGPTIGPNLLYGLSKVRDDYVAFMEDDDWYSENYLREMMKHAKEQPVIIGEMEACYYNVKHRRWRDMGNQRHASLAQTIVAHRLKPKLAEIIMQEPNHSDVAIWHSVGPLVETPRTINCVGIKGMPGRAGMGVGHYMSGSGWKDDRSAEKLRELIGDDAENYLQFFAPTENEERI